MRTIELYKLQQPFATDLSVDLNALFQKLSRDKLLLQQIEQDYQQDPAKYKEEYTSAKRNYLKNRYTYSWLFLSDCFGKAVISLIPSDSRADKERLKEQGWMIPPALIDKHLTRVAYTDETVEQVYMDFFDRKFDNLFNFDLADSERLDRYYKQAIFCYKNKCYYPCAVALFPIIEYFHKRLTDFDESTFYKIKKNLDKVSKKIEGVNHVFRDKVYYFEDLVKQFNDLAENHYFNSSFGANDEPQIINRNRIMHGIFTREITQKDCLQLFCVISNMVVIKSIIDENEAWDQAIKQLNELD